MNRIKKKILKFTKEHSNGQGYNTPRSQKSPHFSSVQSSPTAPFNLSDLQSGSHKQQPPLNQNGHHQSNNQGIHSNNHMRSKSPPSLHSPPMSPISRMPNSPKSPRRSNQNTNNNNNNNVNNTSKSVSQYLFHTRNFSFFVTIQKSGPY